CPGRIGAPGPAQARERRRALPALLRGDAVLPVHGPREPARPSRAVPCRGGGRGRGRVHRPLLPRILVRGLNGIDAWQPSAPRAPPDPERPDGASRVVANRRGDQLRASHPAPRTDRDCRPQPISSWRSAYEPAGTTPNEHGGGPGRSFGVGPARRGRSTAGRRGPCTAACYKIVSRWLPAGVATRFSA